MNKLLLIPLTFMFLLTVFGLLYTSFAVDVSLESDNTEANGLIYNETGSYTGGGVTIPASEGHPFKLFNGVNYSFVALLAIASATGILAGTNILGSGLNENAQKIIYNTAVYFGLFAILSVLTWPFINASTVTMMFWLGLSMMFVIGFASQTMGQAGMDS